MQLSRPWLWRSMRRWGVCYRESKRRGLADHTVVVLTSDNDTVVRPRFSDNSPLRGGKGQRWEESTRCEWKIGIENQRLRAIAGSHQEPK